MQKKNFQKNFTPQKNLPKYTGTFCFFEEKKFLEKTVLFAGGVIK
jgi:hypothetical protein